ncbi:trypsin-like peptidase domain-containing protein [Candidatus Dojkabacteria bacterium]|nr:trypsin-like peptidase domain-containing protein [Candidatus Dojkabacteria bacterium]
MNLFPGSISAQESKVPEDSWESQRELLVHKPALAQAVNIVEGRLTIHETLANSLGAPEASGKFYAFTIIFSSSAFFITDSGYLITNGFVVNPPLETIAYYACEQLSEVIFKDAISLTWEALYGYVPSEDEINNAFKTILKETYGGEKDALVWDLYKTNYKNGEIIMENVSRNYYIQTGKVYAQKEDIEKYASSAKVIDTPFEEAFDNSNFAIIKVGGKNYPIVNLPTEKGEGYNSDEVFILGYSAIPDEQNGDLLQTEEGTFPSLIKGETKKMQRLDGTEYVELKAEIDKGFSGSVITKSSGDVVGIAAFGLQNEASEAEFYYMIPIEDVLDLIEEDNLKLSESDTTNKWEQGLDLYSSKCFTAARNKFEESKILYPQNIDVEAFISKCNEAIENGEDECLPDYTLVIALVVVTISSVGLGLIVFIGVAYVKSSKKKKRIANC